MSAQDPSLFRSPTLKCHHTSLKNPCVTMENVCILLHWSFPSPTSLTWAAIADPPNHKVVVTRTTHPSQGALKQASWPSSQVFPWWSWSSAKVKLEFFLRVNVAGKTNPNPTPSMKRPKGPAKMDEIGNADFWFRCDRTMRHQSTAVLPKVFGFHTGKTRRQVTQEQRAQRNAMQMHQLETFRSTESIGIRQQLDSDPWDREDNKYQSPSAFTRPSGWKTISVQCPCSLHV